MRFIVGRVYEGVYVRSQTRGGRCVYAGNMMINANLIGCISVIYCTMLRPLRHTCRPPDLTDCFIRCTRSGGPNSRRDCKASLRLSMADSISSSTILWGARSASSLRCNHDLYCKLASRLATGTRSPVKRFNRFCCNAPIDVN